MGVLGTWYKVHGILLSFSVPDVIQPTSGTQHGHWLMTTLTIGHLQRVGDMCVASDKCLGLAPCVFHFIVLVLIARFSSVEAFCERYD